MRVYGKWALFCAAAILISAGAGAQEKEPPAPVSAGPEGGLSYHPDERGNRVPDFSYSGYMAGEKAIPDAPARVLVPLEKGDATQRIQSALDYVASLPAGENGIRGAVLLEKGNYVLNGTLEINASGVVLRGSGMGEEGTVLTGAGTTRQTLIRVSGKNDRQQGQAVRITTAYVPVNAREFQVTAPHSFREGDMVLVKRPSVKKWIADLGMEEFGGETGWLGWKPGERDIVWDRKITAVRGNTIVLDAPLTTALDTVYGGGSIAAYHWPGRIRQVGVENLSCRSAYDKDNPKDEAHRWMAITLENVCDAWIRQVVFRHFAGSAVAVYESGKRITVEDCKSLAPVSEIGGQRRYTFYTSGQQTLFQRLYAEQGYHDFAAGFMAAGPNAFVQCKSHLPSSFSGAIDSWASGLLFDNVRIDGEALSFLNRGQDGQGAGWTAANSVMWQCAASRVDCYSPPAARNWAFGIWASFAGNGYWGSVNDHVEPRSLYYAQLAARLGDSVTERAHLLPGGTGSTSSPTVEEAASLAAASFEPAVLLPEWIDRAAEREPIPLAPAGLKTIDQLVKMTGDAGERLSTKQERRKASGGHAGPAGNNTSPGSVSVPILLKNGWLQRGNTVLTGKRQGVRWWRGDARPYGAAEASAHITRFVPGRTGKGYTDDLRTVTDSMEVRHVLALEHNYGLWYDRRRDDHERVRRMNGDVWPPFYELPFARSGNGIAWDGLSKYDLTKYNTWYWMRLREFARLAEQKGLILIHQNYFQHNILEAGAHWADFPWRSANNINNTGFPEPPPYAGDKRIFMARQFYDVNDPVRRELHRAYIRKCLDNFSGSSNVIQLTGEEFTGPLHFVQFWLETILEWEKETGRQSLTGLSATKDVQDSILNDPLRAAAVDIIDIRYWHYREDGSLYAPGGGQSLAPRQHARLVKPGREGFQQVYEAVRQYRERYPGKAVIYSANGGSNYPWAVFMAGGSMAAIPEISEPGFLEAAATMQPAAAPALSETSGGSSGKTAEGQAPGPAQGTWILENAEGEKIIYCESPGTLALNPEGGNAGMFRLYRIDPVTGELLTEPETIKAGEVIEMEKEGGGPVVLWLSR